MLASKVQLPSKSVLRRNCSVLRASGTNSTTSPPPPITASTPLAVPVPASAVKFTPTLLASNVPKPRALDDVMACNGPAPEILNGRLAMLGFVAAIGAEVASQQTILQQLGSAAPAVLATFVVLTFATLVPLIKGASNQEAFGPFTPRAELDNGRAAMLGFAALLIFEGISGRAFV